MYKHMGKVVIKILQGSAVTQTTYIFSGCKFLIVYICQKLWKLAVDKVIAKIIRLTFWPTL